MTKTKYPLKVGFDLDGVILYNPARIIRPMIAWVKRHLLKTNPNRFRIPHSRWEQLFLTILHRSSLFIAPGYQDLRRLVKEGKIEAYLITGRFKFLSHDFSRWLKHLQADQVFKAIHLNGDNQQPHLYKEALIKKYNLDVFIDDNWDIIHHLSLGRAHRRHQALPIWIYNLLDRRINYRHKHPSLLQAIRYLEKTLPKSKPT